MGLCFAKFSRTEESVRRERGLEAGFSLCVLWLDVRFLT